MQKIMLAHSVNIALQDEITQRIISIQKELSIKHKELRFYDSSPHISILTKFMSPKLTEKFATAIKDEFSNDKKWELKFSIFTKAEPSSYVFLNFSEETKNRIYELHNRAIKTTKDIVSLGQAGGLPKYQYNPHISIIKLDTNEVDEAFEFIHHKLDGISMPVDTYVITRESLDNKGYGTFPIYSSIHLKPN